jgi:hypothetical protein
MGHDDRDAAQTHGGDPDVRSYCEICRETFHGVEPGALHRCQEDQGGWHRTVAVLSSPRPAVVLLPYGRRRAPVLARFGAWLRDAIGTLRSRPTRQP